MPQRHLCENANRKLEIQMWTLRRGPELEAVPLAGIGMDGIAQPVGVGFPAVEKRKHCSLIAGGHLHKEDDPARDVEVWLR